MTTRGLPRYPVNITRLPSLGTVVKLTVGKADTEIIVLHLDILSLEEFSAKLNFRPWVKDGVQVDGEVRAVLHTRCPVTLRAVRQELAVCFNARFVPATSRFANPPLNDDGVMELAFEGDDSPDSFEGEELDAWAIALEYLLLEIDPYARDGDARFEQLSTSPDPAEQGSSPFAKLQSLKK